MERPPRLDLLAWTGQDPTGAPYAISVAREVAVSSDDGGKAEMECDMDIDGGERTAELESRNGAHTGEEEGSFGTERVNPRPEFAAMNILSPAADLSPVPVSLNVDVETTEHEPRQTEPRPQSDEGENSDFLHESDSQDDQAASMKMLCLESPSPSPPSSSLVDSQRLTEQTSTRQEEQEEREPLQAERSVDVDSHLRTLSSQVDSQHLSDQASTRQEEQEERERVQAERPVEVDSHLRTSSMETEQREDVDFLASRSMLGHRDEVVDAGPNDLCSLFKNVSLMAATIKAARWYVGDQVVTSKEEDEKVDDDEDHTTVPLERVEKYDGDVGVAGQEPRTEVNSLDREEATSDDGEQDKIQSEREDSVEQETEMDHRVTLEVDVVGTFSSSSDVDVEADENSADEMDTARTSPPPKQSKSHDSVKAIDLHEEAKSDRDDQSERMRTEMAEKLLQTKPQSSGDFPSTVAVTTSDLSDKLSGRPMTDQSNAIMPWEADIQSKAPVSKVQLSEVSKRPLTDIVPWEASEEKVTETQRKVVEVSKAKRMKLTIDRSRKMVAKEDTTGNITMETPHHSQPPFQQNKKSPKSYSQEYLRVASSPQPGPSTANRLEDRNDRAESSYSRGENKDRHSVSLSKSQSESLELQSNIDPSTDGASTGPGSCLPSDHSTASRANHLLESDLLSSTTALSSRGSHSSRLVDVATKCACRNSHTLDPTFHDGQKIERWREMVEAHWFQTALQMSQRPMTVAQKRSLRLLGILDRDV